MYQLANIVAICILVASCIGRVAEAKRLVFANLVWRHGDRSYMESYPNDPYKDKDIWPNGLGQLTKIGMKQQYELGMFIRSRYKGFLSNEYLRKEIYIRSTDKDRTIMSAQSNMAGLYPPTKQDLWNGSATNWQPVPVHTVPSYADSLLQYPSRDCPKYNEIQKKIKASSWYIEYDKNNSKFYDYISSKTGSANRYNLSNVWKVEDNLFCLKSNNFTLPKWATPEVLSKLKKMNSLDMGLLFTDVNYQYRDIISRMQGGRLLNRILQNMTAHVQGTSNLSVIAYSAHDTTLSALLVSIGNYDWVQPKYASCLLFELYEDNGRFYVEIYYKRSTNSEPDILRFYECNETCPFETFVEISQNLIPHYDRDIVCGKSAYRLDANYLWLLLLVGVIVLGLVACVISGLFKSGKGREYVKLEDMQEF